MALDLIFLALAAVLFAATFGLVQLCQRLMRNNGDQR